MWVSSRGKKDSLPNGCRRPFASTALVRMILECESERADLIWILQVWSVVETLGKKLAKNLYWQLCIAIEAAVIVMFSATFPPYRSNSLGKQETAIMAKNEPQLCLPHSPTTAQEEAVWVCLGEGSISRPILQSLPIPLPTTLLKLLQGDVNESTGKNGRGVVFLANLVIIGYHRHMIIAHTT